MLQSLSLDSGAYIDYTLNEDQQALISNNRNVNNIRLRHIKSITVHNFKSFGGTHYVGPFTEMTAVVGPNGGGKSNVLDAIAFTLGLTTKDLRCGSSEELIYSKQQYYGATSKKQQEDPDQTVASVEILFTSNCPEMVRVKRILSSSGQSAAYINDVLHSEEEFVIFLIKSKLHVKSKNFLLLQGDADALAVSSPSDMTELFEKLSGSVQYKQECQVLEKRMDQLKQRITNLSYHKASLRTEHKKLKELLQTSIEFKKINNEIEQLRIEIKLFNLYSLDMKIKKTKDFLIESQIIQHDHVEDRHLVILDLQKIDIHIKQLMRQQTTMQLESKSFESRIQSILSQLHEAEQNKKFINQSTLTLEENISQLQKDLQNQMEMVEEVDLDQKDKKLEIEQLIKYNDVVKIPQKYIQEYTNLQLNFKAEHYLMESEYTKLQQQEQIISQVTSQFETAWRQAQTQYNILHTQAAVEQGEHDQLAQKGQLQQEFLVQITDKLKSLEGLNKQQQDEINIVIQLRSEKQRIIQINEINMTEHIEEEESIRVIQQLSATLPKFMGELSGLINPIALQWSDALKLAIGQKLLCALVVQDTQSSITVNSLLKTMGVVKDIIILEKAKRIDSNQQIEIRKSLEIFVEKYKKDGKGKQSRNGKAILAIDALEYEIEVENVVSYLLRGTILTDSYQLAVEIQQANLPGVYQVITLDGIQLKQGMLMSNYKVGFMRNFRQNNNKQNKQNINENIAKAQKQLEEISQKLKLLQSTSIESQLKESSYTKAELEEQQTIILVQMKHRERQLKQLIDQLHNQQDKMNQSKDEFNIKDMQLQEVKKKLSHIETDVINLKGRFFREFSLKTNLSEEQIFSLANSEQSIKKREALEDLINRLESFKQEIVRNCSQIKKKMQELSLEIQSNLQNSEQIDGENSKLRERKNDLQNDFNQLVKQEHELVKEQKQENKVIKNLIDKRDKIIRKNLDLIQMINEHQLILIRLYSDKQKLIEECQMESIDIQFKLKDEEQNDPIVDYNLIQDKLKIDEASEILKQLDLNLQEKELDANKYLSDNIKVGIVGGQSDQKFNEINEELKELTDKLTTCYEQETEIEDNLKKSKQARAMKFNNFFKLVSEEIDTLYKTLTFQEISQLGGSALLYLENQQEPYKGGIIYTTTPPNKKYVFDNSEQLSGGEKAIASIALLFAINSALGTPFLLLDEVDSNLDVDNTMRLRMVMQALAGKPIQFITISHNIEMFGKAKSLIGVTIQNRRLSSEAFSILLE